MGDRELWFSCFTPPCISPSYNLELPRAASRVPLESVKAFPKLTRRAEHSRNSYEKRASRDFIFPFLYISEKKISPSERSKILFIMTEENMEIEDKKKKLEPAKRDLQTILVKINRLDSASRALALWRFNSRLRSNESRSRKKYFWPIAIIVTIFYFFAKNYVSLNIDRKCLVEAPAVFQKVFRPPEDCSICFDVQQVEKLANVDPVLFEERYAYSGRPVVITDAMANWSATEIFSYSFLKKLYEGQDANCQFFPYKTGFNSLQDVFNMSEERALQMPGTKPWYVGWSNCDETIGSILREHYHRPYFFPATAETEKTDWIFMGSPGYGAPMHVDDVAYPSWQAQIRGAKLWILEPPRECHYTCKRLEVTVQPGEIIILDTNRWYHQTVIISDEMSITIGAEYD